MLPVIDLGFIQVPSFFLVFSIVMALAFYLTTLRSRKLHLSEKAALDLVLVLTLFGLIGARLGHVIFENLNFYTENPPKIFYFWEGGFVFYGGFIVSFVSGLLFLKFRKRSEFVKPYMQLFTPILSLSYALGRIGCFLEGCCYGKYCDLPWAVSGRHPTQLYSVIWELAVFIFLLAYESKNFERLKKNPERLFFIWLVLHGTGRGLIEFLRDDFRGFSPVLSISTWISLVLIMIGSAYLIRMSKVKT
jgi:phosphatidylglycerol---prolipoprotein diacylglyceryl transferase